MKKAVILAEKEFEDMELMYPYFRLKEAGFQVTVAAPELQEYKGKHGYSITSEVKISDLNPKDFDVLIIPGGWAPDRLRWRPEVVKFVKTIGAQGKVIGAICHAASLIISAGLVKGKNVTGYKALKDDILNAGGNYFDKEVVVDGNLVTSRVPADLPAFMKAVLGNVKG